MIGATAARALGGEQVAPGRILCPGPGHSPRDRSLSVTFDPAAPDGFLVYSFADDDFRECRDHVRDLLGMKRTRPENDDRRDRPEPRPEKPPSDAWRGIWSGARSIGGTIADAYLVHRLGTVPDEAHAGALRFHQACPFRLEDGTAARLPAIVALMTDALTGEAVGVHRTALRPDGLGKADMPALGNPKKMLGPARGAVVRLTPDDEVTVGLHIAEGIETALRGADMGFRPIWSALSAGGIARLPVLPAIGALTILADNDANGTGQTAARECAERWTEAGREARIMVPPTVGDFADQRAAA